MRIKKDQVIFNMSKEHTPVAHIKSGETIVVETCDCFFDQIQDESTPFTSLDWNTINPATGPIFIDDAEPGDVLKIEIKAIRFTRDYAVMLTGKNLGVLGDELNENHIFRVPIQNNQALIANKVTIDLNPMIGVIGVAPKGEAISCGVPCEHGGNMDCKEIKAGVTLYLPVKVKGALLALGDLHAAMGDGEISVSGLEIAGEVELTVSVLKESSLPTPMIESEEAVSTIASALTLDEASVSATKKMASLLKLSNQLTTAEIAILLSAKGDLKICQIVDPQKTCRFELSKSILKQLNLML